MSRVRAFTRSVLLLLLSLSCFGLLRDAAFIFGANSSSFPPLAVEVVMTEEMIGNGSLVVTVIEDGLQVFGTTSFGGDVIPPIEELGLLVRLAITTPVEETGLLLS